MIIRKENRKVDTRDQMRGGKGTILTTSIVEQDVLADKGRLYTRMTIKPGRSVGYHEHINEREIYYIIKGSGIATDNGTESPINAGDVMVTGNGSSHGIENTGDIDMEVVALILFGEENYE